MSRLSGPGARSRPKSSAASANTCIASRGILWGRLTSRWCRRGGFATGQGQRGASDRPNACTEKYVEENTLLAAFSWYLEQNKTALFLTFAKIEYIIGKKLCKSAYKYASYWHPAANRPLANMIFNAGYDITFNRPIVK